MQKSKLNANTVGEGIARPYFKETTLKNQKGISLIALIITIIAMLILVGVAIIVALDGGIFSKAEKEKTKKQKVLDEEELQIQIEKAYDEKEGITLISMYTAGVNCEEENCTDEGHLHIGDYVSYIPDTTVTTYYPDGESETNIGANTGYTTAEGATNLQVVEQEKLNWRVLGANGDNVLLISGAPTITGEIYFYGHIGYNNYENILNTACSTLYSKSGIGTARSITMSDIDTYLDGKNFTKSTFGEGKSSGYSGYYGYTNTNITSKFDYDSQNNTLTKLAEGETKTLSLTSNAYTYTASDYITNPIKLELLQGANNYYYWVASRTVDVYYIRAAWCMDYVGGGGVIAGGRLCISDSGEFGNTRWLRPVVSLSSNVTTTDVYKLETNPTETWEDPFGIY